MIQKAHKKADKGFNDIVAQLYEQEFKTQEKAKYEHIRQAKEKALEERRIEAEKRAEADRIAIENSQKPEQAGVEATQGISRGDEAPNEAINGNVGTDWSSVSPEQASEYLASKTGAGASKWLDIIYKESSGNPYVENPIGCWGLLQINQSVHGQVSNLSPQAYLDKAVSIYQGSGGTAWTTW
jgi:soluble lytic murein transglycosylase-like protein|uniref:Transglycosylase-like domain n=1 Tax=Siphoviridae sp. ctZCK1 TaxID=2826382 RepID=A0A8S5MBE2_9CAUD|nr:MAG TPA: Transglycosylase-like domain [Siphoviridae sp. ctZCK1]